MIFLPYTKKKPKNPLPNHTHPPQDAYNRSLFALLTSDVILPTLYSTALSSMQGMQEMLMRKQCLTPHSTTGWCLPPTAKGEQFVIQYVNQNLS